MMGRFEDQVAARMTDPEFYEGWMEAEQEIAAYRASQLPSSADAASEPPIEEQPTK